MIKQIRNKYGKNNSPIPWPFWIRRWHIWLNCLMWSRTQILAGSNSIGVKPVKSQNELRDLVLRFYLAKLLSQMYL